MSEAAESREPGNAGPAPAALPVCGADSPSAVWSQLSIDGLVARPRQLAADELARLAQGELVGDFQCAAGWVAPGQRWEGVAVADLLADAGPTAAAQWVGFVAGGYTVGMTLAEAQEPGMMVALRHNGAPLTPEHGGPCRLVALNRTGRWSVKWLERIELRAEPPTDTGHHQH